MPTFMNTLAMDPKDNGNVVATVRVKHAKASPDEMYLLRARVQGLLSAGTAQSVTAQSVKRAMQRFSGEEIKRFTEIQKNEVVNSGYLTETNFVDVEVKVPAYDEQQPRSRGK